MYQQNLENNLDRDGELLLSSYEGTVSLPTLLVSTISSSRLSLFIKCKVLVVRLSVLLRELDDSAVALWLPSASVSAATSPMWFVRVSMLLKQR